MCHRAGCDPYNGTFTGLEAVGATRWRGPARRGLRSDPSGRIGRLLAHWTVMDGLPEALIDLDAVRDNVAALRAHVGGPQVMAVVKADGYGHGMIPAAIAALAGGAGWLRGGPAHQGPARREARTARPGVCPLGGAGPPHEGAL